MKRYLATLFCLVFFSAFHVYPQTINQVSNDHALASSSKNSGFNKADLKTTPADEPKKVLMHYMGWFGAGSTGWHWGFGQPRTPVIGYYDSRSWATQMYHILLSWSCGIDGLAINIKDDFDYQSLKMLIPTLDRITEIGNPAFKYEFSISYDDQGMADLLTAKNKFISLRDEILPKTSNYLKYDGTPVIFIFNYKDPPYLSADDYKTALEEVFTTNRPKILWNEIEAPGVANSYYPWVKGWADDGSNWGKDYLDWYYPTIATTPGLDFATGGVWAGFDDRSCTWTQNHWMDRKDGEVYNLTWAYPINYSGALPLKWVYIETWNDWNEGSETEPSTEFGNKYLISTIENINAFKGTSLTTDNLKFEAAKKIYEAANLIEKKLCDSVYYYPFLKNAINYFIQSNFDLAIIEAGNCSCQADIDDRVLAGAVIYPNPANDRLHIKLDNNNPYLVQIINLQGTVLLNRQSCTQLETINLMNFPKGAYFVRLLQNNKRFVKKVIIE
jgi:hypothetical protein